METVSSLNFELEVRNLIFYNFGIDINENTIQLYLSSINLFTSYTYTLLME